MIEEEKELKQLININWKKNIAYYYDDSIGCYNYGIGHPMKPIKVTMTHELIK